MEQQATQGSKKRSRSGSLPYYLLLVPMKGLVRAVPLPLVPRIGTVVARDANHGPTNALINGIREACGYRVIPRQSALRGVLAALRRNEVVAILIDQNTIEGGTFVPFFGRQAATVTGPAVFALRTGA